MRIYLLFCFLITSLTASFAQQAVITGDTMLCPNANGTAMVQGIVPYDSYQWQFHYMGETTFVNIPGATTSTFTYDQYTYSTSYIRCQVSQGGSTFYSNELFIDSLVFLPPFFSTDTTGSAQFDPNTGNYLICPGDTVINTIMNGGNVQWFKDGAPIPGANTASYTITVPGTYYATNAPAACPASVSTALEIVVVYNPSCAPPSLDPVIEGDTMLCPESNGTAEVTNDTEYDTYQWQVKPDGEDEFTNIAGATSATFTYDQYNYAVTDIRVMVTLDGETYYSNALFIDSMVFAGLVVEHTTNGQVGTDPETGAFLLCEGASVSNSVWMPYTIVQWYKDGQPIPGATQTTYVITEPGTYYVTGAPASCPDFVQTLPSFSVAENTNCETVEAPVIEGDLLLCPAADGTAEVTNETEYETYQWQVKFSWEDDDAYVDVEGATSASFTYDQYNYSVTNIRVRVTMYGETYYSNALAIDGIVFAGLLVEHTTSGQVSTDPETGVFLLCGNAASVSNTVLLPYTIVQWYKDGQPIEGATDMTYVAVEPGEYYVVGSPAECPDYSETLIPFTLAQDPNCTTGIDTPNAAAFTLYPNPADSTLNISLANGLAADSYTIIDVTGKTLMNGALSGTTPSINIQALAQGSYIITISAQGAQTSKMFIKQ